jgi:hypothetical protein
MTDTWDPTDWRVYFDERAGVAEFDGKLPRPHAEARAFACSVAEWLIRHPVKSTPGCCLHCGAGDRPQAPVLPFDGGPAWLHSTCWVAWCTARKAEATAALRAMGIGPGAAAAPEAGRAA